MLIGGAESWLLYNKNPWFYCECRAYWM